GPCDRPIALADESPHNAIGSDRRSPTAVGQTPPSVPRSPLPHVLRERGLCVAYRRDAVTHERSTRDTSREVPDRGISANRLHGLGRFNLPNTSRRGAPSVAAQRMISSAWKRRVGGIVRPSAWAVLRLMTNSNFGGCSIGRSPGLAPRRILST